MLIWIRSLQLCPTSVAKMLPALPTCHLQLLISASSFFFTDSTPTWLHPKFFSTWISHPGQAIVEACSQRLFASSSSYKRTRRLILFRPYVFSMYSRSDDPSWAARYSRTIFSEYAIGHSVIGPCLSFLSIASLGGC